MDNEFKSEQMKRFLQQKEIEIHWTKPNNHTGNAEVERLHSTLIEKIQAIEDDISLEQKIQKAIGNYNDRYHTTIDMTPREANNLADTKTLMERLNKKKLKYITKLNKKKENYIENRKEGFIKNYKRVRHKDEPYFRKHPLQNVHVSNIKRATKFAGNNNPNDDDNDSTRGTAGTSSNRGERIC